MAKRKATGARKAVGKAYWGGVKAKEGRGRTSASALTEKCVRSGGSREECADAAKAGLKGRRKSRGSGKPWPRKSTANQRAVRREFGKKSKSCSRKHKSHKAHVNCMKGSL